MTTGDVMGCALTTAALSAALCISRLRAPLGPDEGYLWFGMQQVLRGRMPHRDFKSYEPGRYAWLALLGRVFGPGLLTLRVATHLFFAMGLLAALLVLRELGLDWMTIVFAGAALSIWTYPQHRQFEHAWTLLAWAGFSHMLIAPSTQTLAAASVLAGSSLFFGFNLFLYLCAALLLVGVIAARAAWLIPDAHAALIVVASGFTGMLPFLSMLVSRDFRRKFYLRRVTSVLARGSSNLPLPLPWPWRATPTQLGGLDAARQTTFKGLFLALLVVPVAALALVAVTPDLWPGTGPAILAAAALTLVTSHYAVSRADPEHIAGAMSPFCLLVLLVTVAIAPWSGALVLTFSLWTLWPLQPMVQRRAQAAAFCRRAIGGLEIDVTLDAARTLDVATRLCAGKENEPAGFLAAPFYPELYACLSRDSPAYDTYSVYPADDAAQHAMIQELRRAGIFAAMVSDAPLDGRDDLRFSRTHPLVWAELGATFQMRRAPGMGPWARIFTARPDRRRNPEPPTARS